MAPKAPKSARRGPQEAPRSPQEAPRRLPRGTHDAPRRPRDRQEAPKTPKEASKKLLRDIPRDSEKHPGPSARPPRPHPPIILPSPASLLYPASPPHPPPCPPPLLGYDGFPSPLFFYMLPHFPDQGNSSEHRCWMGWWGYAKRQEFRNGSNRGREGPPGHPKITKTYQNSRT